jgi:hypothetical protein
MDTYSQGLDGMWINMPPGLCNGTYYVVVQIDPHNYFLETNENNNVVAVPITLTQQSPSPQQVLMLIKNPYLCAGDNITLTANFGTSYLWNTGATSQSINVSSTGNFTVYGDEQLWFRYLISFPGIRYNSNPPSTTGNSVCNSGSTVLTASGTGTMNWYAASSGGTSLFTGNTFNTPVVNSTATYYADATVTSGLQTLFCPPANNTFGSGGIFKQWPISYF